MEDNAQYMPPMMTEGEAAHFLRASARTLQDWRIRGYGPKFVKVGSRVCYQRNDLVQWIAAQTRSSTAHHTVMAGGR